MAETRNNLAFHGTVRQTRGARDGHSRSRIGVCKFACPRPLPLAAQVVPGSGKPGGSSKGVRSMDILARVRVGPVPWRQVAKPVAGLRSGRCGSRLRDAPAAVHRGDDPRPDRLEEPRKASPQPRPAGNGHARVRAAISASLQRGQPKVMAPEAPSKEKSQICDLFWPLMRQPPRPNGRPALWPPTRLELRHGRSNRPRPSNTTCLTSPPRPEPARRSVRARLARTERRNTVRKPGSTRPTGIRSPTRRGGRFPSTP